MRLAHLALLLLLLLPLTPSTPHGPVEAQTGGEDILLDMYRYGALPTGRTLSFPGEELVSVYDLGERGILLYTEDEETGDLVFRLVAWNLTPVTEWRASAGWRSVRVLEGSARILLARALVEDFRAILYDALTGEALWSINLAENVKCWNVFEEPGVLLLVSKGLGSMNITAFNLSSGAIMWRIEIDDAYPLVAPYAEPDWTGAGPVLWSEDRAALAVAEVDDNYKNVTLLIISLHNGSLERVKLTSTSPGVPVSALISGRTHAVIVEVGQGPLKIFDVDNGTSNTILLGITPESFDQFLLSPDGRLVAIPGYDGSSYALAVLRIPSADVVYTVRSPVPFVNFAAGLYYGWSPDSRYLIHAYTESTQYNAKILVVNVTSWEPVYEETYGLAYRSVFKAITWDLDDGLVLIPGPGLQPPTLRVFHEWNFTRHSIIGVFLGASIKKAPAHTTSEGLHIYPIVRHRNGTLTMAELRLAPLSVAYRSQNLTVLLATTDGAEWRNVTLSKVGDAGGAIVEVKTNISALAGYMIVAWRSGYEDVYAVNFGLHYGILIIVNTTIIIHNEYNPGIIVNLRVRPSLDYWTRYSGSKWFRANAGDGRITYTPARILPEGTPLSAGMHALVADLPYSASLGELLDQVGDTSMSISISLSSPPEHGGPEDNVTSPIPGETPSPEESPQQNTTQTPPSPTSPPEAGGEEAGAGGRTAPLALGVIVAVAAVIVLLLVARGRGG